MTNKEKYREELINLAIKRNIFALVKGVPKLCKETPCWSCDCSYLNKGNMCMMDERSNAFKLWLKEEYIEPPIDWTKVKVDTPILVKNSNDSNTWVCRYFAEYKDGVIYTWSDGRTSWTAHGNMSAWKYAKLSTKDKYAKDGD